MRSWYPGCGRGRWLTWGDFFDDADAVRDELMADPTTRQVYGDSEPFADRVRRELAEKPGAIYGQHGGWALHCGPYLAIRHSHVYVENDDHQHDGYGDPPASVGDAGGPGREVAMVT